MTPSIFNKFQCLTRLFTLAVFFTACMVKASTAQAPAIDSFEHPNSLQHYQTTNSDVSLSTKHYKFGQQSLHWRFQSQGTITTTHFKQLRKAESPLKYGDHFPSSPTLALSIYSPNKQNSTLKFSYAEKKQEKVFFTLPLNFYGWRTIWVPFNEMSGQAPNPNTAVHYDQLTISATDNGEVYLDDIVFSFYQDDRYPYPSLQTPFVQKALQENEHDHWMPLIKHWQRLQQPAKTPLSKTHRQSLAKISQKTLNLLIDERFATQPPKTLSQLQQTFQSFGIIMQGDNLVGPPLTYHQQEHYFDEKQQGKKRIIKLRDFGKFLLNVANSYLHATAKQKQTLASLFVISSRYYLDQGWQAGTSQGSLHHIGYSTREISEAFFIMRQPLSQAGLLSDIASSIHWLLNLGKLLAEPSTFVANIDDLNTRAFYHLLAILLIEDLNKQAELLTAFSHYLSITLAQSDEKGVFKIDGTAWHHGGHYPAYALGAFDKVPPLLYLLANTTFSVSTAGHKNFKKAFLASRIYSQHFDVGFGNAGRHPFSQHFTFKGLQKRYQQLALAGSPSTKEAIDPEVAQAYLAIWPNTKFANKLTKQGFNAEDTSGFYQFPYGATAIYRQNNWAAFIKGYSKYVWASEIYQGSNRYGRYPANGTIQLINAHGEQASGFKQDGWNWNRFPGATSIHLPIDQLETTESLLMFRSRQSFVGSIKQGTYGIFAMQLDESSGFNSDSHEDVSIDKGFAGKLKAKKSVFAFNNKLIAIGTDISSMDANHPVETTLFQTALIDNHQSVTTQAGTIIDFPYHKVIAQEKNNHWIIDPYGNGYHILSNNSLKISKQAQVSYHNKYSKRTGATHPHAKGISNTHGNFASAWLDHGKSPTNGQYQYVIYPFLTAQEQKTFAKTVNAPSSFKILQADKAAHIVYNKPSNTTGYAIFSPQTPIQHGYLRYVSSPSLVMIEDNNEFINLSITEPDLNFAQLKPISGYSQPVSLTVKLKGTWQLKGENKKINNLVHQQGETILTITAQHGLTETVSLINRHK